MAAITDPRTGEQFHLLTRADVGLRAPRSRVQLSNTTNGVFCHHSVTATSNAPSQWRNIQALHMDNNGWADIAYSFGVSWDGKILEGRGMGIAGGHTAGYNSTSHAICFIANTEVDQLPDVAKRAWNACHRWIEARFGPQQVRPHRAVAQTLCPGRFAVEWLNAGRPGPGGAPAPAPAPAPSPESASVQVPPYPGSVLKLGSVGIPVRTFQGQLQRRGWSITVDGVFGQGTLGVVTEFQRRKGLVADGIVGPKTWDAFWTAP